MAVAIPRRTIEELSQTDDFKATVADKLVDKVKQIEVMHNQVLVAIFIRPEKIGSILRPQSNVEEDAYQGKVGLVLAKGKNAFVNDEITDFKGQTVEVGDWVGFRVGDTWPFKLGEIPCRLVPDSAIKMKLTDPMVIF